MTNANTNVNGKLLHQQQEQEYGEQYESEYNSGSENLSASSDEHTANGFQFRQIPAQQVNKKHLGLTESGRRVVERVDKPVVQLTAHRMRSSNRNTSQNTSQNIQNFEGEKRKIRQIRMDSGVQPRTQAIPKNDGGSVRRIFDPQSVRTKFVTNLKKTEKLGNFEKVEKIQNSPQSIPNTQKNIYKQKTPSTHHTLNTRNSTNRASSDSTKNFKISKIDKNFKKVPYSPQEEISNRGLTELNSQTQRNTFTYQSSNTRLSSSKKKSEKHFFTHSPKIVQNHRNRFTSPDIKKSPIASNTGTGGRYTVNSIQSGQYSPNSVQQWKSRQNRGGTEVILRNTAPSQLQNDGFSDVKLRFQHLALGGQLEGGTRKVQSQGKNKVVHVPSTNNGVNFTAVSQKNGYSYSRGNKNLAKVKNSENEKIEDHEQKQNTHYRSTTTRKLLKQPSQISKNPISAQERISSKSKPLQKNENSRSPSYLSPTRSIKSYRSGTPISARSSTGTTHYILKKIDLTANNSQGKPVSSYSRTSNGSGWQSPPNLPRKYTFSEQRNTKKSNVASVGVLSSPKLKAHPSDIPPRSPEHHPRIFNHLSPRSNSGSNSGSNQGSKASPKSTRSIRSNSSNRKTKKYPPKPKSNIKRTPKTTTTTIQRIHTENNFMNANSQELSSEFVSNKTYTPSTLTEDRTFLHQNPLPLHLHQNLNPNKNTNFMESAEASIYHSMQSINDDYYEMPYFKSMYHNESANPGNFDVLSEDCESENSKNGQNFQQVPVYVARQPQEVMVQEDILGGELPLIEERPEAEEFTMSNVQNISRLNQRVGGSGSGKLNRYLN